MIVKNSTFWQVSLKTQGVIIKKIDKIINTPCILQGPCKISNF